MDTNDALHPSICSPTPLAFEAVEGADVEMNEAKFVPKRG